MANYIKNKKLWKTNISLEKIKGIYKCKTEKEADEYFENLKRNSEYAGISFEEWIGEWSDIKKVK
ncbi:hypothetical protein AZF37_08025 [endosymbiont 'TC1' of Trimyema compressum]|uniref:hypothetical protein n=1 Tax=endosymbiont 'TC1' of Trimyema compressum TaxID=243899 RepID=UPI0007F0AEBD|nr:hypothetical protein [endosymbiont 'TC1' of Trimyema compressum]AMP21111.1 hypothetical protein AZF37_08025 [endosymbiont 'TC1' of Trimyema compressum]